MTNSQEDFILNPGDAFEHFMNARKKYLSMLKSPIYQGTGADKRWYTRVPDPTKYGGRRTIRKATREEVEDAVILFFMQQEQKTAPAELTVADCWQRWYEFKKAHNRKIQSTTFQKIRCDRKKYFDGTDFSMRKIASINETDIENYLIEQIEKYHLTQKHVVNLSGHIKGVMFVAYRDRIINANPWDRVSLAQVVYPCCYKPVPKSDEDRILSDIQIHLITQVVENHLELNPVYMPDYGILIAKYTGLRVGEIVALQWDDVKDGYFLIRSSERREIPEEGGRQTYHVGDTKTHKERRVPICRELAAVLERIRKVDQENGIVNPFILFNGTERPNANKLEKAALRRGKEAGIDGTLTIHRIRRTVVSHLNMVYDRATVSHIMGHTEEVDARHYDYDMTRIEDVQETFDSMYA